ncbi:MAG: signal peptidase I [Thermoanaerobaculia bacterium]
MSQASDPDPPSHALPRVYLEPLLVAVMLALFVRTYLVQPFQIPSESMQGNLLVGDHILVNKFVLQPWGGRGYGVLPVRQIERGDVIVFKFPRDPRQDFVKRCVGLPGDVVEIAAKGLYVNGEAVAEPYVQLIDSRTYPRSLLLAERFSRRDNYGPVTVPADHYFCLGDNRDNSNDSRFWGPIPGRLVKGRALFVYWSFDAPEPAGGGIGARLRHAWYVAGHLVARTRWERTFRLVR